MKRQAKWNRRPRRPPEQPWESTRERFSASGEDPPPSLTGGRRSKRNTIKKESEIEKRKEGERELLLVAESVLK